MAQGMAGKKIATASSSVNAIGGRILSLST